ncbi:DUF4851 domain-containing protein [Desulfovibrio sp. OttesenSCG-928-G15]|nr:DUF4851 domain-containing protein [Desulfovibrio sp. OttesenSCG-928-G15]
MHHVSRAALTLFCLALLCLVSSCYARQLGATDQGFYGSGTTGFTVSISPPLELAAAGRLGAAVPSDVTVKPRGSFVYGVYTDPAQIQAGQEITRHAHIIYSELPSALWEWEMETWAKKESLAYEKNKYGGKHWTTQIFPLTANGDWFSDLYAANGLKVPPFWLAKRWSSTSQDYARLVTEYREPAPMCMRSQLESGMDEGGSLSILTRSVIANCEKEIGEFNARADKSFNPGGLAETAISGNQERLPRRPERSPRMDKLVGVAQHIERDSYNYRY